MEKDSKCLSVWCESFLPWLSSLPSCHGGYRRKMMETARLDSPGLCVYYRQSAPRLWCTHWSSVFLQAMWEQISTSDSDTFSARAVEGALCEFGWLVIFTYFGRRGQFSDKKCQCNLCDRPGFCKVNTRNILRIPQSNLLKVYLPVYFLYPFLAFKGRGPYWRI